MHFNKTANTVFDNTLKESKNENPMGTKVYFNTNIPYGFHKRESDTSLKLVDDRTIENYNRTQNIERKFSFSYIYDHKFRQSNFFNTSLRPLANSAFNYGLQHSLLLYEPLSLDYYLDFLGLIGQKRLDECQLFHTLKYIIELSNFKSELPTPVQVSLVAMRNEEAIDLFNQGRPVESPLGYTLDKTEHIEHFLEYSRNLIEQVPDLDHLCVSVYYQNKRLLPRDQVEIRDACINFLVLKGDRSINLATFLNQDKDQMNESTLSNQLEKVLLHFLSANYDPDNLPYSDLPLTYFLKKYLPYSARKDIAFYLDFQIKDIETLANDFLYGELCQEVGEAQNEFVDSEDNEPSIYESRILQNLSVTHDRIKHQFDDLQEKKHQYEESVLKLESASTAGSNPLNQIQKFSLSSQYERFLHEMNHKLKALVQDSNDLLSDANVLKRSTTTKDFLLLPSLSDLKERTQPRTLTPHTRENTVIVKDVKHKYPSIMIPENDHSVSGFHGDFKPSASQHIDTTLLGQIDGLQRELKKNLEFFAENFITLKQQVKEFHGSEQKQKLDNIIPRLMEMKDLMEKHNLKTPIKLSQQQHSRVLSSTVYRESLPTKRSEPLANKPLSNGFDTFNDKKGNISRVSAYQVEDFKAEDSVPANKKNMFGFGEKGITEIEEMAFDRNELQSGGMTTRRGYLSPKKAVMETKMQEVLGITWKKMFAFSYKEASNVMNEVFFNLTKEAPSTALCTHQKAKQKIKPTLRPHSPSNKGQIVSTLEEFRTTYERFETGEHASYLNKLHEDKSFDNMDENDENELADPLALRPSQYFANYSIDTIKPIGNKQSFSMPVTQGVSPFYLKMSHRTGDMIVPPLSSKRNNRENQNENHQYQPAAKSERTRKSEVTKSILQKLDALDKEDARTRVIRQAMA